MAQHAVLSHPDVAHAGTNRRPSDKGWSPRVKFVCFLGCTVASWAIVLAPFFLFGGDAAPPRRPGQRKIRRRRI